MAQPPQIESAIVLTLRDTIKWGSSVQGEPPVIDPTLPFDPTAYQLRDRSLAFRDLTIGAAIIEAAITVSDVFNYSTAYPQLEGAVTPTLSFYGSNTGQVNSQVRHVLNSSIPWDAARYADSDLYGRDALVYEVLARACQQAFQQNPLPVLDSTGTLIPATSAWSLAEGQVASSDINASLPLDKNLFKVPDQNLADRDNALAAYVSKLVQQLKNPFAYAMRLYVQVLVNSKVDREPEVYVLTSDDGTSRTFQTEPAIAGANRIVYNIQHQTLQWVREKVDEVHVPQIFALMIPGISANQTLQTVPTVPEIKDAQYWRNKASQILPNGESLTDVSVMRYTYSGGVTGGVNQTTAASLTAPGAVSASLPAISTGQNRVSVLVNPCATVEVAGSENNSLTGGTGGGVDYPTNVASGSIADLYYYVDGGSGIVYKGVTYSAGEIFAGDSGTPTYTQAGDSTSYVRQSAVTWNMALPPGTWSLQIEYSDLSGLNNGLGVRVDYIVPGNNPVVIAKDITPLTTSGPAGTLSKSGLNFFNVSVSQPFTLVVNWTYGSGQLHVQRLIFKTTAPNTVDYSLVATLGTNSALASFTAVPNQPEVVRFDFAAGNTSTSFTLSAAEVDLPLRIELIDVQAVGTYTTTPLTAGFQGWRQECLDRAERVVRQGYSHTLQAFTAAGSVIPSFRDSGSNWSPVATENWMSFAEIGNPRLREVSSVGSICYGRQYQATTTTVYNGTTYLSGDKFFGVDGVVTASQPVTQVGAFRRSRPGHLGKPCLVPKGLYFNDTGTYTGTVPVQAHWDTTFSTPTLVACQPWMIEQGLYVAQPEFWMPDALGQDLPIEVIVEAPPAPGQIQVTPNPMLFPTTHSGTNVNSSFDVTNTGDAVFSGSVSLSGSDASQFSFTGATGYTLANGNHQALPIRYTPVTPGISDGTTAWTAQAVANFTGGGGATVAVSGTAQLATCPVVSGTGTWNLTALNGVANTGWGCKIHKNSRKLWLYGVYSGVKLPRFSTATDGYYDTLDYTGYGLLNLGLQYDWHRDVFIICDQVGRYLFVDGRTGTPVVPNSHNTTFGPNAPPQPNCIAYDSDRQLMVWCGPTNYPGTAGHFVQVDPPNWNFPTITTGISGWQGGGVAVYNRAKKKVMFNNNANSDPSSHPTAPYWFWDTGSYTLSPSSLTIGYMTDMIYIDELDVVVTAKNYASPNVYIIDGATETVLYALSATGTLGGAFFNPCTGKLVVVLYISTSTPTHSIFVFDPSNWTNYSLSMPLNANNVHECVYDQWSGAGYGIEHNSATICKFAAS